MWSQARSSRASARGSRALRSGAHPLRWGCAMHRPLATAGRLYAGTRTNACSSTLRVASNVSRSPRPSSLRRGGSSRPSCTRSILSSRSHTAASPPPVWRIPRGLRRVGAHARHRGAASRRLMGRQGGGGKARGRPRGSQGGAGGRGRDQACRAEPRRPGVWLLSAVPRSWGVLLWTLRAGAPEPNRL